LINVGGGAAVQVGIACTKAHEAACFDILLSIVDRWQVVARSQGNNLFSICEKDWVLYHRSRICLPLHHFVEGSWIFLWAPDLDRHERLVEGFGRTLQFVKLQGDTGVSLEIEHPSLCCCVRLCRSTINPRRCWR